MGRQMNQGKVTPQGALDLLRNKLIEADGDTSASQRNAAYERARHRVRGDGAGSSTTPEQSVVLAPELLALIDIVEESPGDANIEALVASGTSEDAIFELVVSAALGGSAARLELGLAALQGDEAPKR